MNGGEVKGEGVVHSNVPSCPRLHATDATTIVHIFLSLITLNEAGYLVMLPI